MGQLTSPRARLEDLLAKNLIGEEEFHRRLSDAVVVQPTVGSYIVELETRNDYDGNLTCCIGYLKITENENEFVLSATIHCKAGTNYNPESDGTWTGTMQRDTYQMNFVERYNSHRGGFVYDVSQEGPAWVGTYYWDIKKAATGTATITIYEDTTY